MTTDGSGPTGPSQRDRWPFEHAPVPLWEQDFTAVLAFVGELRSQGVTDLAAHFDDHPDDLLACTTKVRVVDVNRAAVKLHRAPDKAALLAGLDRIFTAESLPAFRQQVLDIAADSPSTEAEAVVQTLDGELRHIRLQVTRERQDTPDGPVCRAVVATSDITDRVQATEASRASEARYRHVVDSASDDERHAQWQRLLAIVRSFPEIIYVSDLDTHEVLFVNQVLADAIGADPIGQRCYEAFQGFEAPCEFCTNAIIQRQPGPHVWEHHNPVIGRDYLVSDQLIEWPDGRQVRFELAVDITARKQMERDLRLKDNVFESSIAAASIADSQGIISHANEAFVKTWGYASVAAALGNSIASFFVREEDAARVLEALGRDGRWEGEFLARRHDGSSFMSRAHATVICDDAGALIGYQSACVDVTREHEAKEQLQQTLTELERSNQELQQFAYVASHDLQEPLRMVRSFTELLAKRYQGELDEKADRYMGHVVDGATRMQQLINDLLAYSRVQTQGRELEPTDSSKVLDDVLQILHKRIAEAAAEVERGELPTVPADRIQLGQVFQNLIGNALKFRTDEPPRVRIAARREGDSWVFSVADNGIGIPADQTDRIFRIFQRLHGRGDYPGSGIGLAITQRIVDRHGGRIWVDSTPGGGATFHFSWPATAQTKEETRGTDHRDLARGG